MTRDRMRYFLALHALHVLHVLHWRWGFSEEIEGNKTPGVDSKEECWWADPHGSKGEWAQQCCRPSPCGQATCWAYPTFIYSFCCDVNACRPSFSEEVKRALDLAVESWPSHGDNASLLAFRTAPEAFRAIMGLNVELMGDHQACDCALALAAAALIWHQEESPKLARRIHPRWFVYHIEWQLLLNSGWGGIFGWLNRFPPESEGDSADLDDLPFEEDLQQRTRDLIEVMKAEQSKAQRIMSTLEDGQGSVSSLLSALRKSGIFRRVWKKIQSDLAWRKQGQRCVAARGPEHLGRWKCEPWTYHIDANFSSILPRYKDTEGFEGLGQSKVAVCVLGAPRTVMHTYTTIREQVVEALNADAFVYVPFPGFFAPALENEMRELGPVVTAMLVPDVSKTEFEARVVSELKNPDFFRLYGLATGPWRAPLHKQMGHSMWGYHNQHGCRRMLESFEHQRAWQYEWIVFARAEMFWTHKHPPLEALDPRFLHIPKGQDNNFYNHNPLYGINDRHAVVPKRWFKAYFNRYESILDGSAWSYLREIARNQWMINTEQYLLLHLQAHQVPILRFPPISFLSHCMEGPQCMHLYKGTDLGKQRWTTPFKYYTEALEVRRTTVDDTHYLVRLGSGWIWTALWPPQPWIWGNLKKKEQEKPIEKQQPHELLGSDVVCGLSKHGPTSSLSWIFYQRCECHRSAR